jgi:hypothetical protein
VGAHRRRAPELRRRRRIGTGGGGRPLQPVLALRHLAQVLPRPEKGDPRGGAGPG